jgi:hypothetical protein
MNLLGLELSDAGILVAGGQPPELLTIENGGESPGFALPLKKQLIAGREAEARARLHPRQIMNRFWDELSTDPLENPAPGARNQAEVACAHLAKIWERARRFGDSLVIAVPGYFQSSQLGLILGMAQELAIPVHGFVSLPVASAAAGPEVFCLHLDIHLHRFEASLLKAEGLINRVETVTAAGKGLECLRKLWAEAFAVEFVRTTRFDPFHRAETEQELFDRLPEAMAALKQGPAAVMAIAGGQTTYRTRLSRDILIEKARPVYDELIDLVRDLASRHAATGSRLRIQLTHRLSWLPGFAEALQQASDARIEALAAGAAALALGSLWRELGAGRESEGKAFFNSRPLPAPGPGPALQDQPGRTPPLRPTHLLYRSLAYPLAERPLVIGINPGQKGRGIRIVGDAAGVAPEHCAVQLRGEEAVLTDLSATGTFVNDHRVDGPARVVVGDAIRLGTCAETILAVACLERDET